MSPVTLDDSVVAAIRAMGARGVSSLPLVDERSGMLKGTIGREDILAAYETAVAGAEKEDGDRGKEARSRSGTPIAAEDRDGEP